MSEDISSIASSSCRSTLPQDLEIGGKAYVLLPKGEYERLKLEVEDSRKDISPFRSQFIGREIRELRGKARLTLSELATKAGICPETLCRIEKCRTNPSVGTVRAILQALGEGTSNG